MPALIPNFDDAVPADIADLGDGDDDVVADALEHDPDLLDLVSYMRGIIDVVWAELNANQRQRIHDFYPDAYAVCVALEGTPEPEHRFSPDAYRYRPEPDLAEEVHDGE